MDDRPPNDGPGNRRAPSPPPSDAAGQSVDVAGGSRKKIETGDSRVLLTSLMTNINVSCIYFQCEYYLLIFHACISSLHANII